MRRTRDCLSLASIGLAALLATSGCGRGTESQSSPASSAPAKQTPSPAPSSAAAPTQTPAAAAASWDGFIAEAGPVNVGQPLKMSDLTPTEQKYGMAPKRGAGVTYQDNVVLMEHGDAAVTSWNTNGLEWTLDASDPQVNSLQEGQILFATSRCVGRVLKLTRSGNDVTVILGPVQLTDLIAQGNLAYDQPFDLNTLTAEETPDYPGAFGSPVADQMKAAQSGPGGSTGSGASGSPGVDRDVAYYVVAPNGGWRPMPTIARSGTARTALAGDRDGSSPSFVRASFSAPQLPLPAPPQLPTQTFNNVLQGMPCAFDCGGLGLRMTAHRAGLDLQISLVFRLHNPHVTFDAGIYHGTVWGQIGLSGAAGLELSVTGTTDPSFTSNLNQTGAIPVDLVLPMYIGGAPLEIHFHQDVSIATAFSAKTSVLESHANFTMSGIFSLTSSPAGMSHGYLNASLTNSLTGDINGVSMGINSIVFAVSQRLLAGVGAGGFAVGPYVGLTSAITALKQATEAASMMLTQQGIADCRQGTFSMQINGGIGYAIPPPVAAVVNFFLGLLHAPPLSPSGTLAKLTPTDLFPPIRAQMPAGCAGK